MSVGKIEVSRGIGFQHPAGAVGRPAHVSLNDGPVLEQSFCRLRSEIVLPQFVAFLPAWIGQKKKAPTVWRPLRIMHGAGVPGERRRISSDEGQKEKLRGA